uniref:Serine-threonine kinase receptor-associated protein n=1 Tax=Hirondellea gigas TaxID=1518452 RepID=A0A6A7G0J2_9CRUS
MRPLLLHGHTRPITCVTYNQDGDLLFTAAKDKVPSVWHTSNGERLGTFSGHTGSVYYLDVNRNSTLLLSASADTTVRIWNVETGDQLSQFELQSAARCCKWSIGGRQVLAVQDNAMKQQTGVYIYNIDESLRTLNRYEKKNQNTDAVQFLTNDTIVGKLSRALWADVNRQVITSGDDGKLRRWDVETGKEIQSLLVSPSAINNLTLSPDRTMIITSNADHTARIYDTRTFELKKEFKSDRPINGAAISPIAPLVLMGGGQQAIHVTTSAAQSGKFETFYYHLIYEELLGSTKGHFGPINDLVMSPDGKGFASGGEDSYVRLHYFDEEFLNYCSNLDK